MRSKTPLALMEQVIMVLVFALAAALCLHAFVLADRISRECEERDRAVLAVQTVAEILKDSRGDYAESERLAEAALDNADILFYHSDRWEDAAPASDALCISILPIATESELLGSAEVAARDSNGDVIIALSVSWQEVSGNG